MPATSELVARATTVRWEPLADGVGQLLLSAPNGNAITPDLVQALTAAVAEAEAAAPRALLVRGTGAAFMVGGDLGLLATWAAQGRLAQAWTDMALAFAAALDALAALPALSIAVLEGAAVGGGLELALAADLRFARPGVRLGLPEARLGVYPAAGGVPRLAAAVGRGRAVELLLTGRLLDADEASALGLVDRLDEQPVEAALALARGVAALPAGVLAAVKAELPPSRSDAGAGPRLRALAEQVDPAALAARERS